MGEVRTTGVNTSNSNMWKALTDPLQRHAFVHLPAVSLALLQAAAACRQANPVLAFKLEQNLKAFAQLKHMHKTGWTAIHSPATGTCPL